MLIDKIIVLDIIYNCKIVLRNFKFRIKFFDFCFIVNRKNKFEVDNDYIFLFIFC